MYLDTMNDIMDIIFDHKTEFSEQSYLDMCNCMKKMYNLEQTNDQNKLSIEDRYNTLSKKYEQLLTEKDEIKLPTVNNEIRYITCLYLASKHNLVREYVSTVIKESVINVLKTNVKTDRQLVYVYMYTKSFINDIEITHYRLSKLKSNDTDKLIPSTKVLKDIKTILDKYVDKNEYNHTLKEILNCQAVRLRKHFHKIHIKPIINEIKFLISIHNSLS